MEQKEYRCVKRTKAAFEKALAELSKETPLNKITVKALCDKADLSRNAFYFHYSDINALIEDIENNMINEVLAMLDEVKTLGFPDNALESLKRLPDIFIEHKDVSIMLLNSSYSSSFTSRLNQIFSDFHFKYYKRFHHTESRVAYDYFYTFISEGFHGMLHRYLKYPGSISRERFTNMSCMLVKRLLVYENPEIAYARDLNKE